MMKSVIAVVGSLNIDYIASVEHLPVPGETVGARGLIQRFGGKGANQAVAVARQGAAVRMIGCVGDDDVGGAYRKRLRSEAINVDGVVTRPNTLTGTALIAVDATAENLIIVAPGANGHLTPAMVRRHRRSIETAHALLLQFEVPMGAVVEAIRIANRAGVSVFLNPSPWRDDFPWRHCRVDSLIVNAGEAERILGLKPAKLARGAADVAAKLASKNVAELVITQGAGATMAFSANDRFEVPSFRVYPVDTVGAGDAFAGTYVVRRTERDTVGEALRHANCAGALATLKPGAQESIPTRRQVERRLRTRRTQRR